MSEFKIYNNPSLNIYNLVEKLKNNTSFQDALTSNNVNYKIEKYTSESSLPKVGSFQSVYFLTVNAIKYLKYWDGSSYINASTRTDIPNCVSDYVRDFYAVYTDVNTSKYNGRCAEIIVIEDSNNNNSIGKYFFNGTTLQEYFML